MTDTPPAPAPADEPAHGSDAPFGEPVGAVLLLRRFPLRSGAAEEPDAAHLAGEGMEGDRRWVVAASSTSPTAGGRAPGEPLRPREHPWLARLHLLRTADAGAPLVALDAGTSGLSGAALDAVLTGLAGTPAELRPAAAGGRAPVHLVGEHAALDPAAPTGCDPGHRANLVLRLLPGIAAGAERRWVGRRLAVGGAVLDLTRTPRHCLGVYADVVTPGRVVLGDAVVLLDASPLDGPRLDGSKTP